MDRKRMTDMIVPYYRSVVLSDKQGPIGNNWE
jgi:hypothetical protein